MPGLFLANVGVNTSDAPLLRSPIFPDGTFEFVPIREVRQFAASPEIPTYEELPAWTGRTATLADYVAPRMRAFRAHADPEFETATYGDVESSRAANLGLASPGAELWFLARLWDHNGNTWTGNSAFYLIGYYVIAENRELPAGTEPDALSPDFARRISRNAHYRRLLAGDRSWNRVIVGDLSRSRRFRYALHITPDVAGLIYGGRIEEASRSYTHNGTVLLNRNGKLRKFETFGSVTRTIQKYLASDSEAIYRSELRALADACGCAPSPTEVAGF